MAAKKKRNYSPKAWKPWQRKLASGLIFLLCLLMVLSLIMGPGYLRQDMDILRDTGNFLDWFSTARSSTHNLVGVFGILFGNLTVYLFGYLFSIIGFALIGFIALQYFIEPNAPKARQKVLLSLILVFGLQVLFSGKDRELGYAIIPGFLWSILKAIFSNMGAVIIVIVLMILSLIMIFEWRTIKKWWRELVLVFKNRRQTKKPAPEKPTINISEDPPAPQAEEPVYEEPHDLPSPMEVLEAMANNPPKPSPKPPPKREIDTDDEDRPYEMPSIEEFLESPVKLSERDRKDIESQIHATSEVLTDKLSEFGIEAEVRHVNIGPIITQYELEPAKGVKVNRFTSLADDLALAIKARSIRVQAPIPGRGLIGVEIPNLTRDMIYLKDLLLSEEMKKSSSKLMFGLGKDIAGKPVVTDLAKMPHLLIAGATGSGKSVCINTIIMSLIMRTRPEDLRLILIDPKRVELAGYNGLPHLIGDVVTEPDNALENMYWAVREMERRYELLQEAKVRDIGSYNQQAAKEEEMEKLPYIIIIVDEFADLIMTSGKDIEHPITRLAQMARAVGIHLILATQRPSIKVITGIIKANFPARIAFQVSSRVDSRVILDMIGAERLLGSGDMLFLPPGKAVPERIHGAFVSDKEIVKTCEFLATQPKPKMDFSLPSQDDDQPGAIDYDDELFPEAAAVVVRANMASVSMLQRHFKIGYARAGRLIDLLERAHIVGPHLGSKSRDVLATREDLVRMGLAREE
ncbi:MAG: DNA translocase FtsK [Candidatus Cloacimonetes bacterium]|nr:DNA translocase FtsK [Candidatus Cloacimonadota bacterium]